MILKKYWYVIIFFSTISLAQDDVKEKYSNTITASELKQHLEFFSSDNMEGRETGTVGQRRAAEYLINYYKNLGLPAEVDGKYQQFYPVEGYNQGGTINIEKKIYKCYDDFSFTPGMSDTIFLVNEMLFLGYGIDAKNYSDYKDVDITGKALLIIDGEPIDKDKNYLVSETTRNSEWSRGFEMKIKTAITKGASFLFIVVESLERYNLIIKNNILPTRGKKKIPVFYILNEMGDKLFGEVGSFSKYILILKNDNKPIHKLLSKNIKVSISYNIEDCSSSNVLGYIEGSDLKDEIIVLSAHYDHLGKRDSIIYNGADDDGSGTVSLLEIAQAFKLAKEEGHGPRRSILFLHFSGEEEGLLGSEYYTNHPIFPLANTVADLNVDMIGRIDANHKNADYVYLIGSDKLSSELHSISENNNNIFTQLNLDYTYNDPNDPNRFYYRSDHYNFAKNKIPVIFYFSGIHEDYHKPTDTVDKILFDKIVTIDKLVFCTAWDLANRDERIKVDSNKN